LPTIFSRFTTASFGDKRSPSENEDNSQQPEQLPTILVNGLWITAEKVNNRKIESGKSCSGTTFPENQIGYQLQHSGSAGNAEERKIPPAWVTAGFFKK